MKYFTYTFTLLLVGLLLSINTYAQEKQNDATWEETVNFIKKYIDAIEIWQGQDNGSVKMYYIKIENYNLLLKASRDAGKRWRFLEEFNFPLGKLDIVNDIHFESPPRIHLELTGDFGTVSRNWEGNAGKNNDPSIFKSDILQLYVGDSELRPRLIKAFEHLAILANEKRAAAREASGDAFDE